MFCHKIVRVNFPMRIAVATLLGWSVCITTVSYTHLAFNSLTGRDLGFSVWVTTSLGWMLLLIFALGVFLSGFYPATILSGIKPIRMLKGKSVAYTHLDVYKRQGQGR